MSRSGDSRRAAPRSAAVVVLPNGDIGVGRPSPTWWPTRASIHAPPPGGLAWEAAEEVWESYDRNQPGGGEDYRRAYRRLERRLDALAHLTGRWLLDLDRIP